MNQTTLLLCMLRWLYTKLRRMSGARRCHSPCMCDIAQLGVTDMVAIL